MKIELGCGDGFLFSDGLPKNIIISVIYGNNEKVTFPYSARKSIAQLYSDINKLCPGVNLGDTQVSSEAKEVEVEKIKHSGKEKFISNKIQREDIVRCVAVEPRDKGINDDIVPILDKQYRVLDIVSSNGVVKYYEVLDDAAETQYRIPMFPNEVELVKKYVRTPKKQVGFESIDKCYGCGTEICLKLEGNQYSGLCTQCGTLNTKERIVK